jgi:hypothetical protein
MIMHVLRYRGLLHTILFAALLSACSAGDERGTEDTTEPSSQERVGEAASKNTPGGTGTQYERVCSTDSQWRTVDVLSTCPGEDKSGLLCYPFCSPGYTGVGPVCWQDCPPGYDDWGASCNRPGNIIPSNNSACPWYDVCGVTVARGCSVCPPGYADDGCTCRIDPDFFFKSSYGRGVGNPMSCAPGWEQIGALCYGTCPAGYVPSGIFCTATTPTCRNVAVMPPGMQLHDFCFTQRDPESSVTPCTAVLVHTDTQQNAATIAQNECTNCTVTSVSCDAYYNDTACN